MSTHLPCCGPAGGTGQSPEVHTNLSYPLPAHPGHTELAALVHSTVTSLKADTSLFHDLKFWNPQKQKEFIKLLCPLKVCVNIDITLKIPLASSKRNPCNDKNTRSYLQRSQTCKNNLVAEWILSQSDIKNKAYFLK